ncbi:MAG: methyltransferase domain-containing protein [Actinomycetota bacterium]
MTDIERGQVAASAADVYEEFFVPALFGQFAGRVCDAARLAPRERVVDVACGTGVIARIAQERVGDGGVVIGVDLNEAMLTTAARVTPTVDWRRAPAEDLPLGDDSVDAALSQFGLMFFEDRHAALAELHRVVRPGGRVVVATWCELSRSPGYAEMTELLRDELGDEAARSLEQPYVLGDPDEVTDLLRGAGLRDVEVREEPGTARFESLRAWLHTDIRGWTLAETVSDEVFDRLSAAARDRLAGFVGTGGEVEFDAPALLATATAG